METPYESDPPSPGGDKERRGAPIVRNKPFEIEPVRSDEIARLPVRYEPFEVVVVTSRWQRICDVALGVAIGTSSGVLATYIIKSMFGGS